MRRRRTQEISLTCFYPPVDLVVWISDHALSRSMGGQCDLERGFIVAEACGCRRGGRPDGLGKLGEAASGLAETALADLKAPDGDSERSGSNRLFVAFVLDTDD
jgi:hypothetical protein